MAVDTDIPRLTKIQIEACVWNGNTIVVFLHIDEVI